MTPRETTPKSRPSFASKNKKNRRPTGRTPSAPPVLRGSGRSCKRFLNLSSKRPDNACFDIHLGPQLLMLTAVSLAGLAAQDGGEATKPILPVRS